MKDHELRELINDATAVAKIYAHTQQLREQISHLITPVFAKAQAEIKAVEDRQLQCATAMRREREAQDVMHEKQVMRQQAEQLAQLKIDNADLHNNLAESNTWLAEANAKNILLLTDIQAIQKLAELVADYNILSICIKAISR